MIEQWRQNFIFYILALAKKQVLIVLINLSLARVYDLEHTWELFSLPQKFKTKIVAISTTCSSKIFTLAYNKKINRVRID